MRVIAPIEDPVVIRKISTHLGRPTGGPGTTAAALRSAQRV